MRPRRYTLAMAAIMAAIALNGWCTRREALACARASSGTDQAIVDCYVDRGLPCPADMCGGAP